MAVLQVICATIGLGVSSLSGSQDPGVVAATFKAGYVFATAQINGGRKATFLIDTGSYRTCVTPDLARMIRGPSMAALPEVVMLDRLQLGCIDLRSLPAGVMPARFAQCWRTAAPLPIDGMIGMDVLSRVRMGIDYRLGLLEIWPTHFPLDRALSAWFTQPTSLRSTGAPRRRNPARRAENCGSPCATRLFPSADGTCWAEVVVRGAVLDFQLDTGSDESALSPGSVGLLRGIHKTGRRAVELITGIEQFTRWQTSAMWLGGKRFAADSLLLVQDPSSNSWLATRSWLGSSFFKQMRSFWDFSGQVLYFAPYVGSKLTFSSNTVAASLAVQDRPRMRTGDGVIVRLRRGLNYVPAGSQLRGAQGAEIFGATDGGLYVVIETVSLGKAHSADSLAPIAGPLIVSPRGGPGDQIPGDVRLVHVPKGWAYSVPCGWAQSQDPYLDGAVLLVPPKATHR